MVYVELILDSGAPPWSSLFLELGGNWPGAVPQPRLCSTGCRSSSQLPALRGGPCAYLRSSCRRHLQLCLRSDHATSLPASLRGGRSLSGLI